MQTTRNMELLAHRALESAAVVVARRGKNASARSSSVRRRAIPDARSPMCTYVSAALELGAEVREDPSSASRRHTV
jgi:hypothetical protein